METAIIPATGGWYIPFQIYYTLTFDAGGGSVIAPVKSALHTAIDLTQYIPERNGFIFAGWYADAALSSPLTGVFMTADTTVYAKWIPLPIPSMENFKTDGAYDGYSDVDENKWYGREGVIRDVTRLGIMAGDGNSNFRPDEGIKLSEVIKMAAVVYSSYSGDGNVFDQSIGENWYDCYVQYAVDKGIIKSGDFEQGYTGEATRSEMACIFAHALPQSELAGISSRIPPDVSSGDEYSVEVLTLYAAGVLVGNGESGAFSGERGITRAEAAAVIARIALPDKRIAE